MYILPLWLRPWIFFGKSTTEGHKTVVTIRRSMLSGYYWRNAWSLGATLISVDSFLGQHFAVSFAKQTNMAGSGQKVSL